MAVTINSNLAALTARKNLEVSQNNLATSIARLSSGMRITRASDDAAGLAISEKLNAQVRGFAQASRNAANGISVVATAEGALNETTNILTRMRELSVQASSGDLGAGERGNLDSEYQALLSEIDRISTATKFNGASLLDGSTPSIKFQIGINSGTDNVISVAFSAVNTSGLGGAAGSISGTSIAGTDGETAMEQLSKIDSAIGQVTTLRGTFGAMQNRLESVIRNLAVTIENTTAANSRIRDVDVAEETASYTKNQILVQAGVSVLAQANQQPSIALSLLK
ncbi:MAG: flagellin N-terminal helical domain-containing protein [Candidatus Deferrimicrobiaceae bacterium]